jgi:hypothetical protein
MNEVETEQGKTLGNMCTKMKLAHSSNDLKRLRESEVVRIGNPFSKIDEPTADDVIFHKCFSDTTVAQPVESVAYRIIDVHVSDAGCLIKSSRFIAQNT